jgi:hypothetical protein
MIVTLCRLRLRPLSQRLAVPHVEDWMFRFVTGDNSIAADPPRPPQEDENGPRHSVGCAVHTFLGDYEGAASRTIHPRKRCATGSSRVAAARPKALPMADGQTIGKPILRKRKRRAGVMIEFVSA